MVLHLFTDGASRGNPGPSGAGVVIEDEHGMKLKTLHRWLGEMTNNEAEYHALIDGLKAVAEWKPDRLQVFADSKLVVEQMNARFRVKHPNLKPLHEQARQLVAPFPSVSFTHIEREKNQRADYLANMAIDEHMKSSSGARHL